MFKWLKNLFNKFISIFKGFIAIAFPIVSQIIIAQLKEFGISVVQKLENTDLSNEEKRNQAFGEIKAEAKRRGIEIGSSLIYAIIEIALQYIKNK